MSICDRVVGRLHVRRVALVAEPQVGRERVGADPGPLGEPPRGAHAGVGDEVDLHLGVRRDDGADVAALDHDVALLAERALALAHHLAHLRCRATTGTSWSMRGSRIAAVTSVPSMKTRPASSNVTGCSRASSAELVVVVERHAALAARAR